MTDNNSWDGLQYCELGGCEEVGVVEISLEYNTDILNAELCQDSRLCRGHADFLIQKVEDEENLDYHVECIKSLKRLRNDLIRRELLRDGATIRVPDEADPLDVIDPNKTKAEIYQAGSHGGQYAIELCESEKHAKRVSANDGALPNRDVLSIAEYLDGEHWRSIVVKLSESVRLDVSQDYKDIY